MLALFLAFLQCFDTYLRVRKDVWRVYAQILPKQSPKISMDTLINWNKPGKFPQNLFCLCFTVIFYCACFIFWCTHFTRTFV